MTDRVFALAIPMEPLKNVVWAFDTAKEYIIACNHLRLKRVPYFQYHGVDRQNLPFPITAWHLSDEAWINLSGGLNDAEEVSNWLVEHNPANLWKDHN